MKTKSQHYYLVVTLTKEEFKKKFPSRLERFCIRAISKLVPHLITFKIK